MPAVIYAKGSGWVGEATRERRASAAARELSAFCSRKQTSKTKDRDGARHLSGKFEIELGGGYGKCPLPLKVLESGVEPGVVVTRAEARARRHRSSG